MNIKISKNTHELTIVLLGWILIADTENRLNPIDIVKSLQCSDINVTWDEVVSVKSYKEACEIVAETVFARKKNNVNWKLPTDRTHEYTLVLGKTDLGVMSFVESKSPGHKVSKKTEVATKEMQRITAEMAAV